jgi:hypothetical protein
MSNRSLSRSASQGGTGFCGLLTIVFVTLKLIGEQFHTPVAEWPWAWVICPLWIPLIVFLAFVGFCLLMALIQTLLK